MRLLKSQARKNCGDVVCIFCKNEIKGFRNALSKREYEISGLCQTCQDKVFGKD